MLIKHFPKSLAELLFRSFDAQEGFSEELEEIRAKNPNRPIVFTVFNAGVVELVALRLFLQKKHSQDFELNYAVGFPRIFFEGVFDFLKRALSWVKLFRRPPSRAWLCRHQLKMGNPVLLNFHTQKQLFLITHPESVLEYLKEQFPDTLVLPLVFIWKRRAKKTEALSTDLSSKLWKTIKAPITLPWYFLLGDPYNPRGMRKFILMLRGYTRSTLRIAPALEAKNYSVQQIRRESFRALQKEKKVVLGPTYKTSSALGEQILRDPGFKALARQIAIEEGVSEKSILKKASSIFHEIAARYSFYFTEIAAWFLEKVFHNIYEGITFEKEELKRLREISKKGVLVYVPNHRSYIDFLVLSYFLFREQFVTPHVMAGINLNFWPAGNFFKMGGAFFIRRSFRGQRLYREVLSRYIASLLNNRMNVEFFIEGTRSRIGKLSPPRYGMLNMINNAYLTGQLKEEVFFVPVSITYDRVTEDRAHKRELEGGKKVKENLLNTLKSSYAVLLKRYGKVHVRFGEQISQTDWNNKYIGENKQDNNIKKRAVQKLAFEISHRINRSTPITSAGLVCTVIMAKPGNAMPWSELERWIDKIKKDLDSAQTPLEPELDNDYKKATRRALARLIDEKVIEKYRTQDHGVGIRVPRKNRIVALYYKNTAIHAFLPYAIKGLCKEDMKKAISLRSFLEFEFFFPEKDDYIKALREDFSPIAIELYAHLLDDTLENIEVGLKYLKSKPNMFVDEKEWQQRFMKYGSELELEENLRRRESINTQSFKAFLEMAKTRQWIHPHNNEEKKYQLNKEFDVDHELNELKSLRSELKAWKIVQKAHLEEKAIPEVPLPQETP